MTLSSGFSSAARSGQAPLQVTLRRGTISESVHRVHAVVCDGLTLDDCKLAASHERQVFGGRRVCV